MASALSTTPELLDFLDTIDRELRHLVSGDTVPQVASSAIRYAESRGKLGHLLRDLKAHFHANDLIRDFFAKHQGERLEESERLRRAAALLTEVEQRIFDVEDAADQACAAPDTALLERLRAERSRLREILRAGPTLHPGDRLGDRNALKLRERLGRHGISYAMHGNHQIHGHIRVVALSGRWLGDPENRRRFEDSVALTIRATGLAPGGVAPVVMHSSEWAGIPYYAVRRTVRGDLRSAVLADRRSNLRHRLMAIARVAMTLCRLHAGGLVHLDIQPAWILIEGEGRALLYGFESAVYLREDAGPVALGAYCYVAPELSLPDYSPDPATDQYQLAMTALYVITGGDPRGDRPLDGFYCPPALRAVLDRALEASPGARFPTIADFGDAFATALAQTSDAALEQPTDPVVLHDVLLLLRDEPPEDRHAFLRSVLPSEFLQGLPDPRLHWPSAVRIVLDFLSQSTGPDRVALDDFCEALRRRWPTGFDRFYREGVSARPVWSPALAAVDVYRMLRALPEPRLEELHFRLKVPTVIWARITVGPSTAWLARQLVVAAEMMDAETAESGSDEPMLTHLAVLAHRAGAQWPAVGPIPYPVDWREASGVHDVMEFALERLDFRADEVLGLKAALASGDYAGLRAALSGLEHKVAVRMMRRHVAPRAAHRCAVDALSRRAGALGAWRALDAAGSEELDPLRLPLYRALIRVPSDAFEAIAVRYPAWPQAPAARARRADRALLLVEYVSRWASLTKLRDDVLDQMAHTESSPGHAFDRWARGWRAALDGGLPGVTPDRELTPRLAVGMAAWSGLQIQTISLYLAEPFESYNRGHGPHWTWPVDRVAQLIDGCSPGRASEGFSAMALDFAHRSGSVRAWSADLDEFAQGLIAGGLAAQDRLLIYHGVPDAFWPPSGLGGDRAFYVVRLLQSRLSSDELAAAAAALPATDSQGTDSCD